MLDETSIIELVILLKLKLNHELFWKISSLIQINSQQEKITSIRYQPALASLGDERYSTRALRRKKKPAAVFIMLKLKEE